MIYRDFSFLLSHSQVAVGNAVNKGRFIIFLLCARVFKGRDGTQCDRSGWFGAGADLRA